MVSNKTYDLMKLIALIGAPIIVFLSALCNIWAVPYAGEITATLAAFDALMGAIVAALKAQYDKGAKE